MASLSSHVTWCALLERFLALGLNLSPPSTNSLCGQNADLRAHQVWMNACAFVKEVRVQATFTWNSDNSFVLWVIIIIIVEVQQL